MRSALCQTDKLTEHAGGMKTDEKYASKRQYDRIARIYDCMEFPEAGLEITSIENEGIKSERRPM